MPLSKIQDIGNQVVPNLGPNRNLIINGAMQIAQRGTSATGIGVTPAYNTVDRWRFADANNPTGRFTQTQSTDAPEGFSFSHKFEVTTIDDATSDNEMQYTDQFIEAQNLQILDYGTSNARTITLSFYVKSSVASTMGVRFSHEDGGGSYGASYTINSVNTWERKSITVPGNTATAINNDNGRGMSIRFGLNIGATYAGAGSNSTAWGNGKLFGAHTNTFVGTSGATWQITGVQLEVGSSASEFEHEPFESALSKCQRYLQVFGTDNVQVAGWGMTRAASNNFVSFPLVKALRATPTVSVQGGKVRFTAEGSQLEGSDNTIVINGITPSVYYGNNSSNVVTLQYDGDTGPNTTINSQTIGYMTNSNVEILFSSEL